MIPDFKALIDRITENEGYRQDVYTCTAGYKTVGIVMALKDLEISPELAYKIIKWQIEEGLIRISKEHSQEKVAELASKLHLSWSERLDWYDDLPPIVKGILIEMSFQLGMRGVSKFKKMLKAMKEKDWKEASSQMLDSKWARFDSPQRAERLADIVREHG